MGRRGYSLPWEQDERGAWCQSQGRSPWSDWVDGPWGRWGESGGRHGGHARPSGPPGPPPWVAGLLGFQQQPPRPQRGPRVRRGDVRSAILDVLRAAAEREEAINGYQVIQQIAERSNDAWRPSPGSVYPTIQQLEDEGLVEGDDTQGRRALRLTEEGQRYVAEQADELAAVWGPFDRERQGSQEGGPENVDGVDLRSEIGQVMSAVWQIVSSGSEQQRRAAVEVLVSARRSLYGILADGPDSNTARDAEVTDPDESIDGEIEEP
ncbi:PadR family transcriptional regulator [Nocardioides insulae]|uniref:PadR family transcriptional regulator n=1 Tax=Nocardioides insulae TaxID=394734 RepID=UPI0009FCDB47|nr:PadR family transcriptional regulator [Nocardioides insulae]